MPKLPKLTPFTSPWMHELMDEKTVLNELLEKHGSPINIHQTDSMEDSCNSYKNVFEQLGLKHKIFFARKANKTKAVVQKAYKLGMGIDTASYQEYAQCLDMGIDAKDLIVTAAVKNRKLIEKAVQHGSLLILDNEDECVLVQKVAEEQNKKVAIGFRISGFIFKDKKLYSRFGFDMHSIEGFITRNFLEAENYPLLNYKGLHFHLNGYSIEERSNALAQCLELSQLLAEKGMKTDFIDIGGGILMNYLKDEFEWDYFHQQHRKSVSKLKDEITFGNHTLGLEVWGGAIRGELKTYPFWSLITKGDFLRKILSQENNSNESVGQFAKRLDIEIRMEPGRSMLDQVGMTAAKVAFRKKDSRGDWLVGLEMNMTQMLSGSADFLLDPFIIYQDDEQNGEPVDAYFTGAYCLERDILLKRKIPLPALPKVGDLVIFVNTAGYMMHFFESSAHLFPLAANLIWNRSAEDGIINSSQFQNDED